MSDPRPPDDGPGWPERDLEKQGSEEPAAGWSDDPYRYEPPPRYEPPAWDPPVFEPPSSGEPAAWEPPVWEPPAATDASEWHPPVWESPAAQERPGEGAVAFEEAPEEEQPAEEQRAEEEPLAADEPPPEEQGDEEQGAEEELLAADEPPAHEEPPADEPRSPEPQPPLVEAAAPTTAFAGSANAWDPKLHGNRRRSTTAEQAVPWLIGIILALAGMVIVLLALIFSSPDGLVAGQATDTASPSGQASAAAIASNEPSMGASAAASGSAEPSSEPTPTPQPNYGALEMVYMGRPSAAAPIYLLRRDFSKGKDPEILAQAEQGVEKFAWSPDGRAGTAVISGRAVALRPGRNPKPLADNVSALTFGWDSETVYAVRINRDGNNDRAHILEIDFVTGATKALARIDYPHPVTGPDPPLTEAQFIDNGGQVRIYAVADGNLAVWILGAPDTYQVDPADGAVTKITRQPTLWSPDGRQRVTLHESGNTTILRLRERSGDVTSAVSINGLVSHVRWAGSSNEIVFTLGRLSGTGGVRQDLYVWDLKDGKDPLPLTSSGAAFGADWRGVMPNWAP